MNRLFGMGYRPEVVENIGIAAGLIGGIIIALAKSHGVLA